AYWVYCRGRLFRWMSAGPLHQSGFSLVSRTAARLFMRNRLCRAVQCSRRFHPSDPACGHHESGGATGLSGGGCLSNQSCLQPGAPRGRVQRSFSCLRYGLLVVIRGGGSIAVLFRRPLRQAATPGYWTMDKRSLAQPVGGFYRVVSALGSSAEQRFII